MKPKRIKLSEMEPGDVGYLPAEGAFVRLQAGGLAGGAEHDQYLALIEGDDMLPADEYPTIVVDTDEVSL